MPTTRRPWRLATSNTRLSGRPRCLSKSSIRSSPGSIRASPKSVAAQSDRSCSGELEHPVERRAAGRQSAHGAELAEPALHEGERGIRQRGAVGGRPHSPGPAHHGADELRGQAERQPLGNRGRILQIHQAEARRADVPPLVIGRARGGGESHRTHAGVEEELCGVGLQRWNPRDDLVHGRRTNGPRRCPAGHRHQAAARQREPSAPGPDVKTAERIGLIERDGDDRIGHPALIPDLQLGLVVHPARAAREPQRLVHRVDQRGEDAGRAASRSGGSNGPLQVRNCGCQITTDDGDTTNTRSMELAIAAIRLKSPMTVRSSGRQSRLGDWAAAVPASAAEARSARIVCIGLMYRARGRAARAATRPADVEARGGSAVGAAVARAGEAPTPARDPAARRRRRWAGDSARRLAAWRDRRPGRARGRPTPRRRADRGPGPAPSR